MAQTKEKQSARPMLNFVPDQAADIDEFGSHTRIARAIADVISGKPDLKVIGLLGPWGSGKSTVVKFVTERLEQQLDGVGIHCFSYDAWLHQSDPPRRSFLEALIRFLIERKLTTESRWSERLGELNRQIEDTDVHTTPTLSRAGRWLLPLALLVPFGMQFLNHDWVEAASKADANIWERVAFPLGLLLTILPVAAAAGLWLRWRPSRNFLTRDFYRSENFSTNRSPFEKETLFSIFTNREVVSQKSRTIRTPDPTTIEFQEIFREILKEVDVDPAGRGVRLLFVIDNLDRLPELQAVEMWATIRSFFLGSKSKSRLPAVLLPIDEGAVERMYSTSHGPEIAQGLAQSFMDKTFDLSFRVTPPVLSNRHRYLERKLYSIFGDVAQSNWAYLVGSMYDAWRQGRGGAEPVTPRHLNALLNNIATLYLQWSEEGINFASISYYVVFREDIEGDIVSAIAKPKFDMDLVDPIWGQSIAAMHYGVPLNDAAQVLLQGRIQTSFGLPNPETLSELSSLPGFELVLNQVLDAALEQRLNIDVPGAIWHVGGLAPSDTHWREAAWHKLRVLHSRQPTLQKFDTTDVATIEKLLVGCGPLETKQFLQAQSELLGRVDQQAFVKPANNGAFVEAARLILSTAKACGMDPLPTINVQAQARAYLRTLSMMASEPEFLGSLITSFDDGALVSALVAAVGEKFGSFPIHSAIAALSNTRPNVDWGSVVDAADVKLQGTFNPANSSGIWALLALSEIHEPALNRINAAVDGGYLPERFHEAVAGNDTAAAGALAALILISKNPSALTTPDGATWDSWLKAKPSLPADIAAAMKIAGIGRLDTYVDLLEKNDSLDDLVRSITPIGYLAGDLAPPKPEIVASDYDRIYEAVSHEVDLPIVTQAASDEGFWSALSATPLDKTSLILGILVSEESVYKRRGAEVVRVKLDALPAEGWTQALAARAQPFDLAAAAVSADKNIQIGGQLSTCLRENFSSAAGPDHTVRSSWFSLSHLLSANARTTLLRTFSDWLASQVNLADGKGLIAEDDFALLDSGELQRHADWASRNVLIPVLSNAGDLTWILEHSLRLKPLIDKSAQETRGALAERIAEMAGTASDETQRAPLLELFDQWDLDPPTPVDSALSAEAPPQE